MFTNQNESDWKPRKIQNKHTESKTFKRNLHFLSLSLSLSFFFMIPVERKLRRKKRREKKFRYVTDDDKVEN